MMLHISISITSRGIGSVRLQSEPPFQNLDKKKSINRLELKARNQLEEYFKGDRKIFSLPLDYKKCSHFASSILKETLQIPYGETRTYSWLAKKSGNPKSFRAVGQVMRRNPFLLFVP